MEQTQLITTIGDCDSSRFQYTNRQLLEKNDLDLYNKE